MDREQDNETKRNELAERFGSDLLFADGFDCAIIGVACGHDSGRVVYDCEKMVKAFMKSNGCDYEESLEFLEFNTFGAYVGDNTPLYLWRE